MNQQQLGWITNFIWGIADDVLRDVYVRGKYRDIILPMTVIRRLDAVLEPTKQAVRALSDTMAVELGRSGITVNHIGPGWVKSFLNDASPSLQTPADEAATIAMIPAGRPAEPEEMGDAVAFLCSDQAAYVTGEYLRVDGGLVVGKY